MNVYLVSHKGARAIHKLEAWADIDKVGENGVYVRAVKAFVKRKEAKEWIEKNGYGHLEIITAKF